MSDSVAFDPEVNEKYVDEAKSAADEYAADGLTELELCAQYCRSCTVSVQRHFHVRSLGEVCTRAMRIGEETFPLDLVEELAQDDDGDVRQLVAEQLGVLAEALRESRTRQEDEVYTGLLCVAFLLVEDDVDGVVSAAEDAVASVAGLLEGHGARELLLTQIANLATCEEEEIRVSGAKILGSLAAVLGPEESASKLAPLLVTLAGDEQFQIREATTRAVAAVGAAARNEDAEATLEPAFRALARDDVWSVRRAVAETLTSMSACLSSAAFEALVTDLFEPLANDVSYQVRAAMLEHLGPLISALGGERASASLVDHFASAARAESGRSSGASGGGLQLACAFNLPGVALAIGRARWHEIREAHATLADSVQWRVRRTVACSLHEVAKILGGDAARADLSPIFEEALKDTDEVRFGAVSNLAAFAREVPADARARHLRSIAGIGEPGGGGATRWGTGGSGARWPSNSTRSRESSRGARTRKSSCRSLCACCATPRTLCARRLLGAWARCYATPRAGRRRRGAREGLGRRCLTSSAWRRTRAGWTARRTSRCAARSPRRSTRASSSRSSCRFWSCPRTTRCRTCVGSWRRPSRRCRRTRPSRCSRICERSSRGFATTATGTSRGRRGGARSRNAAGWGGRV